MVKSFFITAVGQLPGKNEAAVAVLNLTRRKSGKSAYFKPIAQGPDDPGLPAALAAASLPGDPADYFGLTLDEATSLLAQGQTAAILDVVLRKYNQLAARFAPLIIEGVDLLPSGGALANLDADIAANLGGPVILLAENCDCGCRCR